MFRYVLFTILTFLALNGFAQWEYVGDSQGMTEYGVIMGELKFQPGSEEPHFLYQNFEINVAADISMKKFVGDAWEAVGTPVISGLIINNDHLDFDFDPTNANIPIAYYCDGQNSPQVVKLSGSTWENLPGLSNFAINTDASFGFDVGSTGNPVVGFKDDVCDNGVFPGMMTVLNHNSSEWEYMGNACLTPNPVFTPDLEYSPITNELFAYNNGGVEVAEFEYERTLWKLNGNQWDFVVSPPFTVSNVIGNMEINPVTGHVFMYDWDYVDGLGSERLLKIFEWDGAELDSLPAYQQVNIQHSSWKVAFHPVTGEIHILYQDSDLWDATTGYHINVKKFDGANWVNTPFSDIQDHPNQSIAFIDMEFSPAGELYIIRQENFDNKAVVIKHSGISTSLHKQTAINGLNLYPNPAQEGIHLGLELSGSTHVWIYNTQQLIEELVVSSPELSVAHLSPGIYEILVKEGKTWRRGRFVKQ